MFQNRSLVGVLLVSTVALAGCSAPGLALTAAGVATDTSISWAIVKHVHGQLTEGDPVPCIRLDAVQRALNPRCGPYVVGSIGATDLRPSGWQGCLLSVAVRDPRVWPALPDLWAQGVRSTACERPSFAELDPDIAGPAFATASPGVVATLAALIESDPRNRQHDVVRLLSSPGAVAAGLDHVLLGWLDRGELEPATAGFGVFGALHPSYLNSAFARELEQRGHTAAASLGGNVGAQPGGFELALRTGRWDALEWWIARAPELVNSVPPEHADQLAWRPLARVLVPGFLADPALRPGMLGFLVARGADPRLKLPYDTSRSVLQLAASIGAPEVAALAVGGGPAAGSGLETTGVAGAGAVLRGGGAGQ